jgi:hypothetical protein
MIYDWTNGCNMMMIMLVSILSIPSTLSLHSDKYKIIMDYNYIKCLWIFIIIKTLNVKRKITFILTCYVFCLSIGISAVVCHLAGLLFNTIYLIYLTRFEICALFSNHRIQLKIFNAFSEGQSEISNYNRILVILPTPRMVI